MTAGVVGLTLGSMINTLSTGVRSPGAPSSTLRPSSTPSPGANGRRHGAPIGAADADGHPPPAIEIDGLTKRYGEHTVVDGLDLRVNDGELFGLLGTNGAGKTTTVEILQGLRSRDGGRVRVLGLDPEVDGTALRRLIGSQLQSTALPDRLRVGEALRLFAGFHPDPRPADELIEEWNLGGLLRQSFGSLSGGQQQRLFVALALIGRPRLVILDELTQNLDPAGRRSTWEVVRQVQAAGATVLLVTHDVEEAQRLCDRIAVIDRGRLVAEGSPGDLVDRLGDGVAVTFTDDELDLAAWEGLPGATAVSRIGSLVRIEGSGIVAAHVGARLVALGRSPRDLAIHRPSLEDCFLQLTGTNQGATS